MASSLLASGAMAGVVRHATAPLQASWGGDRVALILTALGYVLGAVLGFGVWVVPMIYLRPHP